MRNRKNSGQNPYIKPLSPQKIRLNKYISNTGVCSRREADKLIAAGKISVNGKVITTLGHKIDSRDNVQYSGKTLIADKQVYVLLNKPKDTICTADDPQNRKTVLDLVKNACKERIYPVGRLDRNTTGLLLLTNDGELTKRLTHPSHKIKKIYHVTLDKNLEKRDFDKILKGIELEDGIAKADQLAYVSDDQDKKQIGIELHSGKNRIVRRIFGFLGYETVKLDRVVFAGLTKKDLKRGRWRFLNEHETRMLKSLGSK